MRTTVDLDADILSVARAVSRAEGRSLGRVLSDMARRGLSPRTGVLDSGGDFTVFAVPADAPMFGPDEVAAALDEP